MQASMHANVRVVVFLLFAGFLSAGGTARLWAGVALLGIVYGFAGAPHLAGLARSIARLRFLWLSLLVLYFWFTPGEALWPRLGEWSPTVSGIAQGAVRVGVLLLMVAAAHLLLQSTSTERLVGAVYWLCRPLQCLGFDRARFALRLVLVLETVPRLTQQLRSETPGTRASGSRFGAHVAMLRHRIGLALSGADHAVCRQVTLPLDERAPRWQWLYALLVVLVMGGVGLLPALV